MTNTINRKWQKNSKMPIDDAIKSCQESWEKPNKVFDGLFSRRLAGHMLAEEVIRLREKVIELQQELDGSKASGGQ